MIQKAITCDKCGAQESLGEISPSDLGWTIEQRKDLCQFCSSHLANIKKENEALITKWLEEK